MNKFDLNKKSLVLLMNYTNMYVDVKPSHSILDNLTLKEKVDRNLLKKIINSNLLKSTFNNPYVQYENERKQLEKYLKGVSNKGERKVLYKRSQKINYGRVNPDKALGLHSIRREIRHTLLRDNFMDIDIVNAHPVILLQVCKMLKIKCDKLKVYVKKRKQMREEINKVYKIDNKDISKKLIISLINMGSYSKWLKDNKYEKYGEIPYIRELTEELKNICDSLIKLNPKMYNDIYEYKGSKGNIKASFMSYYLQNIENKILEEVYLYCKSERIIDNEFCILSNDGIMILKDKFDNNLLDSFSLIIKDKFGLDIEYINKEYNEGYSIKEIEMNQKTNITNEIFEELKLSSHQYFSELFYSLNNYRYLFNEKLGWFEYDKFNKLTNYDGIPTGMNNDISKTLQDYLRMEYSGLDPNDKNFISYSKIYKQNYKQVGNTKFIKDTIEKLKSMYNVKDLHEKIDKNNNLLAFNDLVYDLSIKEYRQIRRDDYIEKHIKFNAPLTDDMDIQNHIIDFVDGIQKTKEESNFLLKVLGNSLFKNKYEKIYILQGRGGNGKGVLMSLLENSLGHYLNTASSQFLTSKYKATNANPELFSCLNKRVVVVNEPEENEGDKGLKFNIEFVKKITSNDTISARALYKNKIEYEANFSTFVQCNDVPELDKVDGAVKRRFVLIVFPFRFTDNPTNENEKLADYTLKDLFKDNEEYHRQFIRLLIKNIDFGPSLKIPKSIKDNTNEYFEDNNFVLQYLNDNCEITKDNKDRIKSNELYNAYKSSGLCYLSSSKFKTQMLNNNISCKRFNKGVFYYGIKWKEEEVDDLDI